MPELPAFCVNCGLVFDSGVAVASATRAALPNATTPCPRCGHVAQISDTPIAVAPWPVATPAPMVVAPAAVVAPPRPMPTGTTIAVVDVAAFQAHLLSAFHAAVAADALKMPPDHTLVFTGWRFEGAQVARSGLIELRQAPGLVDFVACQWVAPDIDRLPAVVLQLARQHLTAPLV